MKQSNKRKTIRYQILEGYLVLTGIMVILVALFITLFAIMASDYNRVTDFQKQQHAAQQVITAHYQWLEQLSDAITTGSDFKGSLDPDTCALGTWINTSARDLNDYPELSGALSEIMVPHDEIHSQAAELIALAKKERDAAYDKYGNEFKPKVVTIEEGLESISGIYRAMADEIMGKTRRTVLFSTILIIGIGICSTVFSITLGRRMSLHIAKPILAVARWSAQFSTGVDNLEFDSEVIMDRSNSAEIMEMIMRFQEMAENIRNHVNVIQKVAEGDLTAYVDIRSEGDSLGKGLYHMVQNNDYMFANLLEIADTVATNADQIACSSQILAESSSTQAGAVEQLTGTIRAANDLAGENAENASSVSGLIGRMSGEVVEGQEKMDDLLAAVKAIETASAGISSVMKSINEIAFQTNILALNAAVEAARAGSAGKGFAVVADEVRNLALKSQEAAEHSRTLIENTISRASEGGSISMKASETFRVIVKHIQEMEEKIGFIDTASARQQDLIRRVNDEINRISSAVTENAATSEQTAASTQQMNASAAQIKIAMQRFKLRKRVAGQPYIPPEKSGDPDFIELASRNYEEALRAGKVQG